MSATSRNRVRRLAGVAGALFAVLGAAPAVAQTSVSHGRITAMRQVEVTDQGAATTGAVVGGVVGIATGSGKSKSNRALRTLGGSAVGRSVAAGRNTIRAFEYTVLIEGSTVRVVTEQVGMRIGDCVAVERGQFNNLRMVGDERCDSPVATPAPSSADAEACSAAKRQLIDANTDQAFARAERRVRLLCGD